jgi:hypothetical protein
MQNTSSIGTSPTDYAPSVFSYAPYANGFVVTGAVLSGVATEPTAGTGYTLVAEQPGPSVVGNWQAGEYALWGQASTTTSPFVYPSTNDGWAEVSVSFAPSSGTSTSQPGSSSTPTGQVTVTTTVGTVTDYTTTNVIATATTTLTGSQATITVSAGDTTVVTTSTVTFFPWYVNPGNPAFLEAWGTFILVILGLISVLVALRRNEARGKRTVNRKKNAS